MLTVPGDVPVTVASELSPAPHGVHAESWRAFGTMFDIELVPITRTLTSLNLAVGELQDHAVHRVALATTNLNVQAIANSITVFYQTYIHYHKEIQQM